MNRIRHAQSTLLVITILLTGALGLALPARAQTPAGVAEYLVPFDEDVFAYVTSRVTNATIGPNSTSRSQVDVTAWSNSVVVYYDHWENGYGLDPLTLTGYDEVYTINTGQNLNFLSTAVPRPRTGADGNTYIGAAGACVGQLRPTGGSNGTDYCYDGRDRFVTVGGATTVTRGGWLEATGIHASIGEEVYPLAPQLIKYILPFGESATRVDYERVVVVIQATEDDTTLRIDFNGDGVYDSFNTENGYRTARTDPTDATTLTLDRGESYVLDRDSDGVGGTLNAGVVMLGDKTLQVEFFYGDFGSTYNTRAVAAYPRGFWSDEYYAPVDGAPGGYDTDVTLYNPNASTITIDWQTAAGSGSFTMAPNETAFFQAKSGGYVPDGSALYLKGSDVFWGISDVDTNGPDYDWSYSLVPSYLLRPEQFVSWAPGNIPVQNPPGTNGRALGVFVTPIQDGTTFFVDKNGDGTPDTTLEVILGATAVTPTGSGYRANRLQSLYITDNDGDLTGARIWATGPFAMAFGENPQRVTISGGIDLGYTVLPSPADWMDLALTVDKATDPVIVSTVQGATTVTYTLTVDSHLFNLSTIQVVDTLPANWEFISNSATITFPNLTQLTGSAANPTVALPNLTWPSSLLGSMLPNQRITITFQARTTAAFTSGALTQNNVQATGTRTVGAVTQNFTARDFAFNTYLDSSIGMEVVKSSSVPEATPASPGDTITYTVTVTNPSTSTRPITGLTLFDELPPGVSFVAGSAQVVAPNPATSNVRDNFTTQALNNNDGSANWAGAWVESDGTQSASGGNVRIDDGNNNQLRLGGISNVYRQVNLSGRSWALLTFTYSTSGNRENADQTFVEVASSATPASWTTAFSFVNDASGSVSYYIPPTLLSATTTIRFRNIGSNNEYSYFDNVDVTFPSTTGTVTLTGQTPPMFVTGGQGLLLGPGQSLTLTFSVTVDNPFPAGQTEILNVATAQAAEIPVPISDDARNIVLNPAGSSASVGDRVWLDSDGDGVLDVGEPGLPGVEVTLKDQWGTPLQITTTDSLGRYTFVGVPPGTGYFVEVTGGLPGGLTQTTDSRTDRRTSSFDLAAGQSYETADLGFRASPGTATIGDLVWSDADGDGIRDPGEPGLAGVVLSLLEDTNGDNAPDANPKECFGVVRPEPPPYPDCTTTTAADGSYLFSGIVANGTRDYFVTVSTAQPALSGYTATTALVAGFPNVPAGAGYTTADFGFRQQASGTTWSITDRVWLDNGAGGGNAANGTQDGTEAGISGVTVALLDASGNIVATTTTGANGNFQFTGVPAGQNYRWQVTDTFGVLSGYYGTTASAVSGQFQMTGNLSSNIDFTTAPTFQPHFGYNVTRAIGDTVFNDLDGSGTQNGSEAGINGVVVQLYLDRNGNGVFEPTGADGPPVAALTTDANGKYLFAGLPNGRYWVNVDPAQSALSGYTTRTTPDENGAAGDQRLVDLSGTSNLDADFGYRADTSYTISGNIWNDVNGNALDDGEAGLSGVTLELVRNGVVIATTATNAAGDYSFPGLPGGSDYTVRVTDVNGVLSGYTTTYEKSLPPYDGEETVTNLSANVTDLHFGFYKPIPVPVSLSWFRATPGRQGVRFEWETSTETGNVGFNLLGEVDGSAVRLNEELIASKVVDSLWPVSYEYEAETRARLFWLEEVDLFGETRRHGPFGFGLDLGRKEEREVVRWEPVRRESREKEVKRASLAATGVANLLVSSDGMVRVTYEDLRAAGFDWNGMATAGFAMTNRGRAVPILVTGAAATPTKFGPGGSIVFWGERVRSLYTDANVYRLTASTVAKPGASRIRIAPAYADLAAPPVAAYRETETVDRNLAYSFASPTGDPWHEKQLLAYRTPVKGAFPVDLRDVAPGADAELTVRLWGSTDWPASPDHHVVLRWNGVDVGEKVFDGIVDATMTVPVPASLLSEGTNTLEIEVPGDTGVDWDLVVVDSYSLTYTRAFRAVGDRLAFTAARGPFAVDGLSSSDAYVFWKAGTSSDVFVGTGTRVEPSATGYRLQFGSSQLAETRQYRVASAAGFVPARIEPARAATTLLAGLPVKSLIVAHPDFLEGIAPLVAARQAAGVSVKVVDVRDVYESYSGGIVDPAAIRAFVKDAWSRWKVRSLLLVGGDTYDYFDNLGLGSKSFIPTLYAETDPIIVKYAPADPLFGDVNGDGVPEVSVGRLPVRSSAELQAVIGKTTSWTGAGAAVLAADLPDGGLRFSTLSDQLAANLPAGLPLTRAYMDTLGIAGARTALKSAMNGGNAFVNYFGHSSYTRWSFSSVFTSTDAAALTNAGRPLVVSQLGCWNNYFVDPMYNTLGHVLLLGGDRGAVATMGSATLTDVSSDAVFGPILTQRLSQPRKSIGQALLEAKTEMERVAPGRIDIQVGFTLLGDPELVLFR